MQAKEYVAEVYCTGIELPSETTNLRLYLTDSGAVLATLAIVGGRYVGPLYARLKEPFADARTRILRIEATVDGISGAQPVTFLGAGNQHFFLRILTADGGGGGLPEPPDDGRMYARRSGVWVPIETLDDIGRVSLEE